MIENDVIKLLAQWLTGNGWTIEATALNRDRGDDIRARRGPQVLLVEAKGAKGNPNNHGVVRSEFDSGQIKDHLGKAIVKAIEMKIREPRATVAIAHPATDKIIRIVKPVAGQLTAIGIAFAFVKENGQVEWVGSIPEQKAPAA